MGVNSSKKLAAKCSFLSKDEQIIVSQSFRLASKNSEKIKEDELTVSLSIYFCFTYTNLMFSETMGNTNGCKIISVH